MTNGEKFKTAKERAIEFDRFCYSSDCGNCVLRDCRGTAECRYAWLDLKYKKPPREIKDIIKELRELSSVVPMPPASDLGNYISTIYGKPVRFYLGDLADEIEAAWNRRAK